MQWPFPVRKIIHVDMDAFYASVEQLDNPELMGKPVAVGGGGARGVVSAASYEARKFGVRSAMSGVVARNRCPELIFVKPRFDRYKEVSRQIRSIFHQYTDLVEPLSLDEAFLDVTENKTGCPSATVIAQEIRAKIKEKTSLTASAGVSINKFVAKIASDLNKPDGLATIPPEKVLAFLEELDVKKFFGVGKVTKEKMYRLGIFTGKDLKARSLEELEAEFGSSGGHFYKVVRGIHESVVKPSRNPKSLAAERTFSTNISSEVYLMERLESIAAEVERRLKKARISGKTVTLKIKYSDFTLQTRSKTLPYYVSDASLLLETVKDLLYQEKLKDSVRLLGISISNLQTGTPETVRAKEDHSIDVQLKLEF
jgi:DNA polymerase-4